MTACFGIQWKINARKQECEDTMGNVRRIYVEKKDDYAVKGKELLEDISSYLNIASVKKVRELIRYDVENITDATFEVACKTVFSEPPVDFLYLEELDVSLHIKQLVFAETEPLTLPPNNSIFSFASSLLAK